MSLGAVVPGLKKKKRNFLEDEVFKRLRKRVGVLSWG